MNNMGKDEATAPPPVYKVCDYILHLRRYCKYSGLQLYLMHTKDDAKKKRGRSRSGKREEKEKYGNILND